MGEVIQMFKAAAPASEEFSLDDLSTEYLESIGEVISDLETIFESSTVTEFMATMRSVKTRVGEWPDG